MSSPDKPPAAHRAIGGRLDSLAATDSMRAIRDGLLCLVPGLLVSGGFLVMAVALEWLSPWPQLAVTMRGIHAAITATLPLLAAAAIGYILSARRQLPRIPVTLLCVLYVTIVDALLTNHSPQANALLLFLAIVLPLGCVPALARLAGLGSFALARDERGGAYLRRVMNLIVPAMLVGVGVFFLVGGLLSSPLTNLLEIRLDSDLAHQPWLAGSSFALLHSLLWFFAIDADQLLHPLIASMDLALTFDQLAVASGMAPTHLLNRAFVDSYVLIGGSGASLSLAIALLVQGRNHSLRLLALAGLPLSLLGSSQLLLFGLPILFNPRLALPFVLAPLINLSLALAAVSAGLVAPGVVEAPPNSPFGLNAYLASGGDTRAVLLQLALLLTGVGVYLPFLRRTDPAGSGGERIHFRAFDLTWSPAPEPFWPYTDDPAIHTANVHRKRQLDRARLDAISAFEFLLEYQPQVCALRRRVTGCEALLRYRQHGQVRSAGPFIAWLQEAGLMKQVDWWVAQQALAQDRKWQAAGVHVPISINVSADTLTDPPAWRALAGALAPAAGRIAVEISEQTIAADPLAISAVINAFHRVGAPVHIDGFGTGRSSLASLHLLDADAIKLDRNFALALESDKGRRLMRGMIALAAPMDLTLIVAGIETPRQLAEILSDRPMSIQGWLFGKSMPADQIPTFLAEWGDPPEPGAEALDRTWS